jgi:teichoic acid ribitol-phosphate primase
VKRRLLLLVRIWLVRLVYLVARRFPVRRRVVLVTSHTGAIRGDLAAIRAEIARRDASIPVVALVHTAGKGLPAYPRAVVQGVQAAWHLATAALFVVDSHYLPIYVIRRRPGTTVVQTWHACGAIKKIGYSVLDKSFGADALVASLVRLHTNYDLCLAASAAAVEQYVDAFRQPASLFVTDIGMPRTDVLCDRTAASAAEAAVRRRYGLTDGRRVILYAPTFRGDSMIDARHPADLDLQRLAEALGADHRLLLRLHPAIRSSVAIDQALAGFVVDVSDYPEVNDLMLASDVLVTDYSSVIFEFALLGRPMAFFAPDTDAYERERGFYFDYRAGVPGPVFESTDDLATWLRRGPFDTERVRAFASRWFEVADGHASARFFDRVVRPALDGSSVGSPAASPVARPDQTATR